MSTSPLLQANRRVQSAQRIYNFALDRVRPGDAASLCRLTRASYVLGLARERYVEVAKRRCSNAPATLKPMDSEPR